MNPQEHPERFLGVLAFIGAAIGIGKLLAGAEPLTLRVTFGRALVSAGIGAAAGATALLFPSADPLVMYGVAAGLASLGTSALESVLSKRLGGGQ
ncbi:MAG: holin [Comamonadaceae bacterium]|nr:holin [Comamonadaceae bacterium]